MPTLTNAKQNYDPLIGLQPVRHTAQRASEEACGRERIKIPPRLARRARAFFAVLILAGERLPRLFGSALLGAFFLVTLLFGIIGGGHGATTFKILTSTFGLAVTKIDIVSLDEVPLSYISEIDILDSIDLDGEAAMLAFDVQAAHERIVSQPFVHSAVLRKIYPDRLHVAIKERRPMALWQHQGQLDVIDGQGEVIVPFAADMAGVVSDLPLLVGRGANKNGAQILGVTENFKDFRSHIRAYRRVADRRWDIVLDNGVEIKLPEHDFEVRLGQMLALDEREDLLARDVLSLDLRLEDRLSVILSDEAMARWRKEVAAAEQAQKAQKSRGRG